MLLKIIKNLRKACIPLAFSLNSIFKAIVTSAKKIASTVVTFYLSRLLRVAIFLLILIELTNLFLLTL